MSSLAAARADNFYYPPEWTPEQGSLNKFHGQHALRERARKLGEGILIIRFEMPFHVWCGGCGSMVAKGVRFNAEKKQIGNYYSTKIWSFKMKAACCQHQIEIHTDPKNCDYIVVSGAEKKVVEYDAEDAGTAALPTDEEREQLADPFFRVEHLGEDAKKAKMRKPELGSIKAIADARHSDPWRLNSKLRAELRAQKQRVAVEEQEARSKGLAIRLLPSSEEDRKGAALVAFRGRFEDNQREKRAAIRAASIFADASAADASGRRNVKANAPASTADRLATDGTVQQRSDAERSAGRALEREDRICEGPPGATGLASSGGKGSSARTEVKNRLLNVGSSAVGKRKSRMSGPQSTTKASVQSDTARRAELAAKRRKIDARGVMQTVVGRA